MISHEVVEVLLVEDNRNDAEPMRHAVRRYRSTYRLQQARTPGMYRLLLNKPPIVD